MSQRLGGVGIAHGRSLAACCVLIVASYVMVARSCGYDHASLLLYAAYVGLFIGLPGYLCLSVALDRHPSLLEIFALGLPLGFAVEISLFFLASANDLKLVLPFTPALWLTLAVLRRAKTGPQASRAGLSWGPLGCWWMVALLVFAFTATIASQFYVCAPLAKGVLGSSTNQDWIYLLSRAGEIKHRWPLEDPSLAGTPLNYHYFLLAHLASASFVTGLKLELIGLRLWVLPLSAALLAQSLYLGKTVTRNIWGGVIATALLLVANELSFKNPSAGSSFANEFVRWLFFSPTFFFGMIFTGALLIWIYRLLQADRLSWPEGVVLGLLAAAGTGAKGTVVPPLLVALSLWWLIEFGTTRRFPVKTTVLLVLLGGGFGLVYFSILSDWGTGDTSVSPLFTIKLSQFWQDHAHLWVARLESWGLSPGVSLSIAHFVCAIAVLIGFSGIRLLGLVALSQWKHQSDRQLTLWLGLTAAMYFVFGHFLVLDSNSQFYLLFPLRLPEAVLAAAAILWIVSWVKVRLADFPGAVAIMYGRQVALLSFVLVMGGLVFTGFISWWMGAILIGVMAFVSTSGKAEAETFEVSRFGRFAWRVSPLIAIIAVTLIQMNHWRLSNVQGFKLWMTQSTAPVDRDITLLREGMDWIRHNTPVDSVFVANAFSEKNLAPASVALIDNTTVDKYYYYSALAERRFWVEGPTYLMDRPLTAQRITTASKVFSGGPIAQLFAASEGRPNYIMIDRALNDGATVKLPPERRVFENARIVVYHLNGSRSPLDQPVGVVMPTEHYGMK